jgi:hypothetical protein
MFHKGELNLNRLNYGLISLIPKLKEANNVKQFRPACSEWIISGSPKCRLED